MAEWPELDELKKVLDVTSDDFDTTLARALASAITAVKSDRGSWDENVDSPSDNLSQAALRMAELIALRPEAAADNRRDPTYLRLMFGQRRRFGIS